MTEPLDFQPTCPRCASTAPNAACSLCGPALALLPVAQDVVRLQTSRRRIWPLIMVGVGLVLIAVASIGLIARPAVATSTAASAVNVSPSAQPSESPSGSHTLVQPATLGSLPQLHNNQVDALLASEQTSLSQAAGVDNLVLGAYGDTTHGQIVLFIGVQGQVTGFAQSEFIDSFASSASTGGTIVDKANPLEQTSGGTAYTCYPISGQANGAVCSWADGDILGSVVSFAGVDTKGTLALAEAGKAASEK